MDITVEHIGFDPTRPPLGALPGERPNPDDLPLSAAIYDTALNHGSDSRAVVEALYAAVKELEALVHRTPR
ncbi:hypothetical protein ACWEVD_00635 [Nocardia thailandica]